MGEILKICSRCKEAKEYGYFRKDINRKDGFYHQCKECEKRYYLKNKEKKDAYLKEYALKHKEEITKYKHNWYLENVVKEREQNRILPTEEEINAKKEERKERTAKKAKEYKIKHKEEIEKYAYDRRKRLCEEDPEYKIKLGVKKYVSFVLKPEILKRDNYRCALCKKSTSAAKIEVHHIVPLSEDQSLGEINTNLICLCVECHFHKAHASYTHTIDKKIQAKLQKIVNDKLKKAINE